LQDDDLHQFIASHYGRLVAGLSLLAGRAAAEDAVQEALCRAWERSLGGERIQSLPSWVAVVATNLLRSRVRRLLAERRAGQRLGVVRPRDLVEHANVRLDVLRAIQALPRRQRQAVILYYFADLGIDDIARAMRTGRGGAKSLLHRGRDSLGRALGPSYHQEVTDDAPR
jgi:RNA polymerase sigma-70 factor (ECF subfamily)